MFLSLRRATTAPNKLIDSQHHKGLRRKILTAFYLLSHFTLTTTQLSLSLLTLNYNNCADLYQKEALRQLSDTSFYA